VVEALDTFFRFDVGEVVVYGTFVRSYDCLDGTHLDTGVTVNTAVGDHYCHDFSFV
jgi:hypothetical protein